MDKVNIFLKKVKKLFCTEKLTDNNHPVSCVESPQSRSSPPTSQRGPPQSKCLPGSCLSSQSWWTAPRAWCLGGWSTVRRWVPGPSPTWWSARRLGSSMGCPGWWTRRRGGFRWLETHEPGEVIHVLLCYTFCLGLYDPAEARCSNLEGLREKVRRKLPEAATGDDSPVAKVQEKHLQEQKKSQIKWNNDKTLNSSAFQKKST